MPSSTTSSTPVSSAATTDVYKVKPGITGWAQINGFRGETDTVDKMRARVEHDIFYIENWSLWFDFKIMILTAFAGWTSKNAY
ncbi:MAG: sugar transferase [Rhodospirillales bacterium]